MSKVETGQTVNVHYTGTFEDGTKFDSSHDRGETLTFQTGTGQVVNGFDAAVVGMNVGETKSVTLPPSEAYGDPNPDAVQEVPMNAFGDEVSLTEGVTIMGHNEMGQQMVGKVLALSEETATIDFNHPLAGKTLNFEIELVSVN
jgi:FKBP-type peptidyl-prolyl cis-trans isomerase 2